MSSLLHNRTFAQHPKIPSLHFSSQKSNMSRESIRQVSFSPDTTKKQFPLPKPLNHLSSGLHRSNLAAGFIHQLKAKLTRALCFACMAGIASGTDSNWTRSSRRVSSSSLARSRSYAEPIVDTYRAEAVEDCIEFLNASSFSTFQRSSSTSVSSSFQV
ncbi:hypothetical protein QQ045_021481 [Rhodiola kirilowii]